MTSASRRAADELASRSAVGEWFVIDHPLGALRPAVHVFACGQSVGYADGDRQDPGHSRPAHDARGQRQGPRR